MVAIKVLSAVDVSTENSSVVRELSRAASPTGIPTKDFLRNWSKAVVLLTVAPTGTFLHAGDLFQR